MNKVTMIDAEDIRSWAAYRRNRRRLQRERWMVSIVTLSWLMGLAILAAGYMWKERALACERAKLQKVFDRMEGGVR
jgi:hypothetical protein